MILQLRPDDQTRLISDKSVHAIIYTYDQTRLRFQTSPLTLGSYDQIRLISDRSVDPHSYDQIRLISDKSVHSMIIVTIILDCQVTACMYASRDRSVDAIDDHP